MAGGSTNGMSVFNNAMIAMADVLGSRNCLRNADGHAGNDLEGHYAEMRHSLMTDAVAFFEDSKNIFIKAFSDNFNTHSDDYPPDTVTMMAQGMAGLQYNAICEYSLLLRGFIDKSMPREMKDAPIEKP